MLIITYHCHGNLTCKWQHICRCDYTIINVSVGVHNRVGNLSRMSSSLVKIAIHTAFSKGKKTEKISSSLILSNIDCLIRQIHKNDLFVFLLLIICLFVCFCCCWFFLFRPREFWSKVIFWKDTYMTMEIYNSARLIFISSWKRIKINQVIQLYKCRRVSEWLFFNFKWTIFRYIIARIN